MKHGTRILLLALLAWGVGTLRASAQLLSPGALSKAHRELEGDGRCQRCHASGAQVAEPRCLDCHADIAAQRRDRLGLHGGKFLGERCASCHVEHIGREVSLIRWPGPDMRRFDHDKTGFTLRGAHTRTACRECHEQKNERGAPTFLAASPRCATCHEDPHDGRFGERCQSCHDEQSFKRFDLASFDHGLARFSLDGAHADVGCAKCHGEPARYTGIDFSDCKSCHEDPHAGRLEAACKSCHTVDAWKRVIMPRTSHPGLSLANGHANVACERCHDGGRAAPPRGGNGCVSCHAEVHEAPFGTRCEQCHASIRFTGLPDDIGRTAHAKTAFPLRGEHGEVACAECHLAELPTPKRYRSLEFETCAGCHVDVHKGSLREHGDCAKCHTPLGFTPSLVNPQLHAGFGFTLEGNHAATACSGCHASDTLPRVSWTQQKGQCHDCHANPHGTQFAEELRAGGCAHCHSPKGWRVPTFDHASWPLTGAHAKAACSGCHEPAAGERSIASYRGVPRTCEGCHDDVHAGQFRASTPEKACASCHTTDGFALPGFQHEAHTGFPLEGKHASTSCGGCHERVHLRDGEQVVRYRLGYRRCADCHADPHTLPEAVHR